MCTLPGLIRSWIRTMTGIGKLTGIEAADRYQKVWRNCPHSKR